MKRGHGFWTFATIAFATGCGPNLQAIEQSRRYPERVRWPAEYTPEESSFFVHNAIRVRAPAEDVWAELIEAEAWPTWYEGAKNVVVEGRGRRLERDAIFTWTTMDLDFVSTIREFEPPYRLAWESEKSIIQGYHAWLIIPTDDGCIVITDEAQKGFLTFFEKIFVPNKLRELHDVWLAHLKERAEARAQKTRRKAAPSHGAPT
ncbi:MAG: SRPBCC domain-containing protein [Myxococcota bacterium]